MFAHFKITRGVSSATFACLFVIHFQGSWKLVHLLMPLLFSLFWQAVLGICPLRGFVCAKLVVRACVGYATCSSASFPPSLVRGCFF